jgi:hypothetical protein
MSPCSTIAYDGVSNNFFWPGLALNHEPSHLCLPSSQDYKHDRWYITWCLPCCLETQRILLCSCVLTNILLPFSRYWVCYSLGKCHFPS